MLARSDLILEKSNLSRYCRTMPAKNLKRKDDKGTYFHVYNRGIEGRTIFGDDEDFQVFLGFLKEYLSAPDPESAKKTFSVNGRIFTGTPHQPKNFHNKVELLAYSLVSDHFHLLLHQKTHGSLKEFIKSLCTRYSIYFNKRYKRTGSLFTGPYKSAQIDGSTDLLNLTHFLHNHLSEHTSLDEYLGLSNFPWVKQNLILPLLTQESGSYKNFVEHELSREQKESIKDLIFENTNSHLERRNLARNDRNFGPSLIVETAENIYFDQNLKPFQRIPEALATAIVFIFLVAFGVRNISISTAKSASLEETKLTPIDTKIIEETATDSAQPVEPKNLVTVKIEDGSESVNIRRQPTVESEKVGQAVAGETFEYLEVTTGWYEIQLSDGTTGFIFEKYINK